MGGCRCSFYKCSNNTTLAKELNSIHSHFFHFPIRDLPRVHKWAIYSNNLPFLSLPIAKLKNKVICDMHFPESSFMNYTRSKLNKTTAIPTCEYARVKFIFDGCIVALKNILNYNPFSPYL